MSSSELEVDVLKRKVSELNSTISEYEKDIDFLKYDLFNSLDELEDVRCDLKSLISASSSICQEIQRIKNKEVNQSSFEKLYTLNSKLENLLADLHEDNVLTENKSSQSDDGNCLPSLPHPARVLDARDWLKAGCPHNWNGSNTSDLIKTILSIIKVLPTMFKLYRYGSDEWKEAMEEKLP